MTVTPAIKEEIIVVGLGEMAISKDPEAILTCLGLGSCIALCAYDPVNKVGGMVHIVLPQNSGTPDDSPAKYADTAVPLLLQEMAKSSASKSRLIVKLVGGAQMSLAPGLKGVFNTGERNVEMVIAALNKEHIAVSASDIGGNKGRTVQLFPATGRLTVKSAGSEIRDL
jgi:chemotaxis protein CheD